MPLIVLAFAAMTSAYAAVEDETVARVHIVEYLPGVDCVFIGSVLEGGVNRALFKVETSFAGPGEGEEVVVAGFNTVEFNSAHYRLERGMKRLVFGYLVNGAVYVPSPYSGCFPAEGGRVVLTPYRGASPTAVGEDTVVSLLSAFFEGGEAASRKLAAALESPAVEARYLALVLSGFVKSGDLRPRVGEYLKDDNPVLREAAAAALTISAEGPEGMPKASALDAQGVAAVWRILRKRLDAAFGGDLGPWAPVAAGFVGAAEEVYEKKRDLSGEMSDSLTRVVDEGLNFLWLASPFSTERVGELLAYRRLKPGVLQILSASLDESREEVISRYLLDSDMGASLSASAALRRLQCDYLPEGIERKGRSRWYNVRRLEALPEEIRGTYASSALHGGDYALFRLSAGTLLRGDEFPFALSVVWRELAYPSVMPTAMLLPFGSSVYDRMSFFRLGSVLTRRFPEAAPLLEYWVKVLGRYGGAYEREAAMTALSSLPRVTAETLEVLKLNLDYEESTEVRKAAFESAQALGLPLLFYRYMEDPPLNREALEAAVSLWKPIERAFPASVLPFEKGAGGKDEGYAASSKALLDAEKARSVFDESDSGAAGLLAASGLVLERLRGGRVKVRETPEGAGRAAEALLAGYGLGRGGNAAATEGILKRATLFGAPGGQRGGRPTALAGAELYFAILGRAMQGEAQEAWKLFAANSSGIDSEHQQGIAETLLFLDAGVADTAALNTLVVSGGTYEKIAAARILYRLGKPVGKDQVRSLLKDGSSTARMFGCHLAGRLGDNTLVPELARLVEGDEAYVAYRAAKALARIGGEEAFLHLWTARETALDSSMRSLFTHHMTASDPKGLLEAEEVLAGSDWNARYYAVLGMSDARYEAAKRRLLHLALARRERLSALAEACLLDGEAPEITLKVMLEERDKEGVALLINALKERLQKDKGEATRKAPAAPSSGRRR